MKLVIIGLALGASAYGHDAPGDDVVRAAAEKAIPLLLKATAGYAEKRACFSCHHQAVPVLALATASRRGLDVPDGVVEAQLDLTEDDLRGAIESYRKGAGQGGGVSRAGYALFTLELGARVPDDLTDAVLAMAAAGSPEGSKREATDDLLRTRRADGGWSQVEGGESDAYATGTALVALHLAGRLATDDPVYRQGLRFLIAAQRDDGSWFVKSRSKPFQPYFESGFPHGKDQFISMAASSWAVTALCLALPER
jgi:hypothetical protein